MLNYFTKMNNISLWILDQVMGHFKKLGNVKLKKILL